MEQKMTTYEIHLALCIETVDIWSNPEKSWQLAYADTLDRANQILEPHAIRNTLPSREEWAHVIGILSFLREMGLQLTAIIERAEELAAHPEYFDAELNQQQRLAYEMYWDKSCIRYYTEGKQ